MSFFAKLRRLLVSRRSGECESRFPETARFIALIVKSGLRNFMELYEAFHDHRRQVDRLFANGQAELSAFCDYLVSHGLLTRWQCERLLKGRWKGFFLDDFKILRHLGCDETCSRYAAEEVHTGRTVTLRIWPRFTRRHDDGSPHYEVEETTTL